MNMDIKFSHVDDPSKWGLDKTEVIRCISGKEALRAADILNNMLGEAHSQGYKSGLQKAMEVVKEMQREDVAPNYKFYTTDDLVTKLEELIKEEK